MHSIFGHVHFYVPPFALDTVSACCIGLIFELFRMVYSDMCIAHFVQVTVSFPTVTALSISGSKVFCFLLCTGIMKILVLSYFSLPLNTHWPST